MTRLAAILGFTVGTLAVLYAFLRSLSTAEAPRARCDAAHAGYVDLPLCDMSDAEVTLAAQRYSRLLFERADAAQRFELVHGYPPPAEWVHG